jgi:hypothetical protein
MKEALVLIGYSNSFDLSDEALIREALKIDELVFDKALRGTFDNALSRHKKNNDCIIFLMHEGDEDRLFDGCITLLPLTQESHRRIWETADFLDDDLTGDDITGWDTAEYILLLSIGIVPSRQGGEGIIELSEAFEAFILEKSYWTKNLTRIYTYACTNDGLKAMTRLGFQVSGIEVANGYKMMWRDISPH